MRLYREVARAEGLPSSSLESVAQETIEMLEAALR